MHLSPRTEASGQWGGAVRQAARIDANQPAIVNALRQAGATVQILSHVGKGCPDLLVTDYNYHTGRIEALLVEVKTEKGELTPDEARFFATYPDGGPLIIARSADDVLRWFGRME